MRSEVSRLGWMWALLVPILASGVGSAEAGRGSDCDWSVSGPRPASPSDVGYEDLDPCLRDPENANDAPGPGDLFAVVRSDSLHRPHIYVEDRLRGTKRELLGGSQPRWSPDGTRIACTEWKSTMCFSTLLIIDVGTGNALSPDLPCNVVNYRWSPDGRSLAVAAVLDRGGMNALFWVHLPSGRASLLDTLTVFSDYEDITWSPDSRAMVVTRVTATEAEGEPTASDLWLFDANGQRCALTKTKGYLESEPKWIDARRLLYARRRVSDPDLGNPERRVITLSRGKSGTEAK